MHAPSSGSKRRRREREHGEAERPPPERLADANERTLLERRLEPRIGHEQDDGRAQVEDAELVAAADGDRLRRSEAARRAPAIRLELGERELDPPDVRRADEHDGDPPVRLGLEQDHDALVAREEARHGAHAHRVHREQAARHVAPGDDAAVHRRVDAVIHRRAQVERRVLAAAQGLRVAARAEQRLERVAVALDLLEAAVVRDAPDRGEPRVRRRDEDARLRLDRPRAVAQPPREERAEARVAVGGQRGLREVDAVGPHVGADERLQQRARRPQVREPADQPAQQWPGHGRRGHPMQGRSRAAHPAILFVPDLPWPGGVRC
jgi:hypothetical protein